MWNTPQNICETALIFGGFNAVSKLLEVFWSHIWIHFEKWVEVKAEQSTSVNQRNKGSLEQGEHLEKGHLSVSRLCGWRRTALTILQHFLSTFPEEDASQNQQSSSTLNSFAAVCWYFTKNLFWSCWPLFTTEAYTHCFICFFSSDFSSIFPKKTSKTKLVKRNLRVFPPVNAPHLNIIWLLAFTITYFLLTTTLKQKTS